MQCAVIDYGAGNLRSVVRALNHVSEASHHITATTNPDDVLKADAIILPGVGAFGDCGKGLRAMDGMIEALEQRTLRDGIPFLGICVGMQFMAERGEEYGTHQGLGWLPTKVSRLTPSDKTLKIPHMGWNQLVDFDFSTKLRPLAQGINEGDYAYFVHSYHMTAANDDTSDWLLATTDYGGPVTAIVGRDNMVGTQFHPEKSQKTGLTLLKNFLTWRP